MIHPCFSGPQLRLFHHRFGVTLLCAIPKFVAWNDVCLVFVACCFIFAGNVYITFLFRLRYACARLYYVSALGCCEDA